MQLSTESQDSLKIQREQTEKNEFSCQGLDSGRCLNSKKFPTYPWNIPQTPNQQFMKEFLSIESWLVHRDPYNVLFK